MAGLSLQGFLILICKRTYNCLLPVLVFIFGIYNNFHYFERKVWGKRGMGILGDTNKKRISWG